MNISKTISSFPFPVYRVLDKILNLIFRCFRFLYKEKSKNSTVLIISLHKIGDSVFTIPALKVIISDKKKSYTILCFNSTRIIYQHAGIQCSYIAAQSDEIIFGGRLPSYKLLSKIVHRNYNSVIDLTGNALSAFVALFTRTDNVVGSNEELYRSIYDSFQPMRRMPHLMDLYIDTAEQFLDEVSREKIKFFPIEYGPSLPAAIHPFAGWSAKEWGINKFVELAVKLSGQLKLKFILPEDKIEPGVIEAIKSEGMEAVVTHSIEELIGEIRNSSMLIANDSGPLHLAHLCGKPTVSIFGPTNPLYHVPFGKFHKFVMRKLPCSPGDDEKYCFTDGGRDGCPSNECMHQLEVNSVERAVNSLLQELKHDSKEAIN